MVKKKSSTKSIKAKSEAKVSSFGEWMSTFGINTIFDDNNNPKVLPKTEFLKIIQILVDFRANSDTFFEISSSSDEISSLNMLKFFTVNISLLADLTLDMHEIFLDLLNSTFVGGIDSLEKDTLYYKILRNATLTHGALDIYNYIRGSKAAVKRFCSLDPEFVYTSLPNTIRSALPMFEKRGTAKLVKVYEEMGLEVIEMLIALMSPLKIPANTDIRNIPRKISVSKLDDYFEKQLVTNYFDLLEEWIEHHTSITKDSPSSSSSKPKSTSKKSVKINKTVKRTNKKTSKKRTRVRAPHYDKVRERREDRSLRKKWTWEETKYVMELHEKMYYAPNKWDSMFRYDLENDMILSKNGRTAQDIRSKVNQIIKKEKEIRAREVMEEELRKLKEQEIRQAVHSVHSSIEPMQENQDD